jgi:fluoroacetyl-CoA thioesterase
MERIVPGLRSSISAEVTEHNTARHLGSGNVNVFATPEMIRLMETAAVRAVDDLLPQGQRTVGFAVDVRHVAATPVGMTVTATAELLEVEGRKLTFRVEAHDDAEKIGEGTHVRVVVEIERFAQRLDEKSASGEGV